MTIANPEMWAKLAAPLPSESISWRIDSKPKERDGKFFARFVCYVEAGTVRARLDDVCPGQWSLEVKPFGEMVSFVAHEGSDTIYAVVASLTVMGITRECIGQGDDLKQAATDAFKRAAVRFGIGHELYNFEQNWVQVDGDGKYAKAVEDPQEAYERRQRNNGGRGVQASAQRGERSGDSSSPSAQPRAIDRTIEDVPCPKCSGRMWDNRLTKRNPKQPDFKCRDRSCDGVIWPPKNGEQTQAVPLSHVPMVPDDADLPF